MTASTPRSLDALSQWCSVVIQRGLEGAEIAELGRPPLPDSLHDSLDRNGFDSFDGIAIALILAPDLDPTLGLALSELTGVRSSRYATVSVIADLVGARGAARVGVASRLSPGGPLSVFGLIHLVPPPEAPVIGHPARGPSLLDSCVAATALLRWSFGITKLEPALFPFVRDDLSSPSIPPDPECAREVTHRIQLPTPTITALIGGHADTLSTALYSASHSARPALVVDSHALVDSTSAARVAAEAMLRDAIVVVTGAIHLVPPQRWGTLATIVTIGSEPLVVSESSHDLMSLTVQSTGKGPIGAHLVDLLRSRGLRVPLSEARRITGWGHLQHEELGHIADVLEARARGATMNDGTATVTAHDVVQAIVGTPGDALSRLSTPLETTRDWKHLVVPAHLRSELHELVEQAGHREQVLDASGFGRVPGQPRGVTAVFAGPSGTGKTLAARIVAGELGLPLYAVNLATIVSKYIGETEKNLEELFSVAEGSNAVLLIDEAESLFGKRSEVQDARDRYANLEVSYLLQRMERYDGVAILATNLLGNFDDAFARRLTFCLRFPYPDDEQRRLIWRAVWPAEVALDGDVDFDELAATHSLSGGHIRNVAVAATHLARKNGGIVNRSCILRAIDREYAKLGQMPDLRPSVVA